MTDPRVTTDGLVTGPDASTAIQQAQWAVATGTADAIVAAYPTPNEALTDGLLLAFRASAANLTDAPTFAPDGLTAHPITQSGGQVLRPGQIPGAGAEILVRYNLANTRWELLLNPINTTLFRLIVSGSEPTGGNVNTAQPWFPSAPGVTLQPGTYVFDGLLFLVRTAGTTSHTTSLLFGGTAVLGGISYFASALTGDASDLVASDAVQAFVATGVVVKAASTSATELASVRISGTVVVVTAGTLIPQFQYSAAPGGAPKIAFGTYFRAVPYVNPTGTWA